MKTMIRVAAAAFVALAVFACSSTSTPPGPTPTAISANLQTFATQAGAYVANFNAQAKAVAHGVSTDALALGKSACGAASMLNGVYQAASPLITAATKDASLAPTETATYAQVQADCAVVDAADPTASPTAALVTAAAAVAKSVPALQDAVNQVSPAAGAAVQSGSAPAPATSSSTST